MYVRFLFKGTQSALGSHWSGHQFSHFEKTSPQLSIKVHLEFRFNLRNVLFDFQSSFEKPVLECAFAHPILLFLSYLVKNSVDCVSMMCKLANAHVRQLTVSLLTYCRKYRNESYKFWMLLFEIRQTHHISIELYRVWLRSSKWGVTLLKDKVTTTHKPMKFKTATSQH